MDKQNVKIETEKMLAGEIYDPMEKDLVSLRQRAHRLSKEYNECLETDEKRDAEPGKECLPAKSGAV